jgi:putative transposase
VADCRPAYVELLTEAKVAISIADVGEAWQNSYAERVIRTIKEEEVALSDYQDFHDAYQQTVAFSPMSIIASVFILA